MGLISCLEETFEVRHHYVTVTFLDYLFRRVIMYKLSIHEMVLNSRDLERTEGKSWPPHYILSLTETGIFCNCEKY